MGRLGLILVFGVYITYTGNGGYNSEQIMDGNWHEEEGLV